MSSGYSRIQKYVRETAGTKSLSEAGELQNQPLWLLVNSDVGPRAAILAQAISAMAVRACTGSIEVRVAGDELAIARIRQAVELEASGYGCLSRVNFQRQNPEELVGFGLCVGMVRHGFISVDASGMYAAINCIFPTGWPMPHASSACFAAAAAYAKYFGAHVIGRGEARDEAWVLSLETMETVTPSELSAPATCDPVNLGEVHLLGGGAIGSAFSYVARLSQDVVDLDIVDKDRYEEPNQETTFFLSHAEALRRQPKAQALAGSTARFGLRTTFQPQMEIASGSPYLVRPSNAFICAVDNPETRRALDATKSDVLLNAGLGGSRLDAGHVLATWHNATTAPLSTVYPETADVGDVAGADAPSEITDDCSRLEYASASLAAPFIALAAGAVLFALARQSRLGRLPDANYIKFDLLGWQQSHNRRMLKKLATPPTGSTLTSR